MNIKVKRAFKERLYGQFARIGKALASPQRLELLELLAQGERTVESLANETAASVANTSRHLQQLRQAQLVTARRDGLYMHYRLTGIDVIRALVALRQVGERHLAEVDRVVDGFFGERDKFEPVTPAELTRRLAAREVVLLDVRPLREFEAGHIAGAISFPVEDLKRRMRELPRDTEYVAYCRGPYCVYADEAVALLQSAGRAARRLAQGYPEWLAAGRPVRRTAGRDRA